MRQRLMSVGDDFWSSLTVASGSTRSTGRHSGYARPWSSKTHRGVNWPRFRRRSLGSRTLWRSRTPTVARWRRS